MLAANKLKDLGLIARILQQQGPHRIRDHFRQSFAVNAVLPQAIVCRVLFRLRIELRTHLSVTTGRDEQQVGVGLEAVPEGIVRGGVAGVECDQNVGCVVVVSSRSRGRWYCTVGNRAEFRLERRVPQVLRHLIDLGNEFGSEFEADRLDIIVCAEKIGVERHGEVASATAHVRDANVLLRCTRQETGNRLDEFVTLLVLGGLCDATVFGLQTERFPERIGVGHEAVLGPIVVEGGRAIVVALNRGGGGAFGSPLELRAVGAEQRGGLEAAVGVTEGRCVTPFGRSQRGVGP